MSKDWHNKDLLGIDWSPIVQEFPNTADKFQLDEDGRLQPTQRFVEPMPCVRIGLNGPWKYMDKGSGVPTVQIHISDEVDGYGIVVRVADYYKATPLGTPLLPLVEDGLSRLSRAKELLLQIQALNVFVYDDND